MHGHIRRVTMFDQFYHGLGHKGIFIGWVGTNHGPQERGEDFFSGDRNALNPLRQATVTHQQLMTALVCNDGRERKIIGIGITFECLWPTFTR